MLRPCLTCGTPAAGPRCTEHTTDRKGSARARGYDAAWDRLSARARRLQPFCELCGSHDDLQCDHTPEAWARKAAGKIIRLQDVRVLCGPCNRRRGPARGTNPRGDDPPTSRPGPASQAKFASEIGLTR